ncbi:MAG: hypothetical protein AAF599_17260 [Bacteroidota bacterium]
MKQIFLFSLTLFTTQFTFSQTALDAPLPERFDGLKEVLLINHFPNPVYATTDEDSEFQYLWKHTTSVLSVETAVQIESCGAYIFYNNQWNLRVDYQPKDCAKLFDCPKAKMKKGQPYTFKDNWRTDNALRGGWAMWYFIGRTDTGEQVYGVGKIDTVGEVR